MEIFQRKSLQSSLFLALITAVTTLFLWEMMVSAALFLSMYLPSDRIAAGWPVFVVFLAEALLVGYLSERYSVKKVLTFAVPVAIVWFIAAIVTTVSFSINLYFLRGVTVLFLPIFLIHLKKLWLIDSELTDKLVELASAGHILEGKSADLRIESGLRLLETVLPLSEAIVFKNDPDSAILTPIGRSRNGTTSESLIGRQMAWRESVALCERAFETRSTVLEESVEGGDGSAKIALPLIYENVAVGVLCVKAMRGFEPADKYLLEGFSGQLARNFQRKQLRSMDLPNKFWWSFLSTNSADNRIGTTTLIKSLMKEQSFSAVASSYLKESHAIAYLDGTVAYLNRKMRHMADISHDKIGEIDLFGLLEKFKTDAFSEPHLAVRRVLQTGETYRNELYFTSQNRTLDLQISLVKVPSEGASIHETNVAMKPACFLITMTDITAVKENERLRSDMASLMSHEIRTPITSIKGFAELLMTDETLTEENREFVSIIASESQRLSKMISTFLSVSNLEQSDKKDVAKSALKLDNVVHEVVGELTDSAKKKRIRLVEQTNQNLPPIAADRGLIRRAVSNLIDNAIKYSPERSSVIISTILEADFLRVVVEDRGYGIPSAEKEKIWQKFYRIAHTGRDKEEESTGLGLSLVKEIVEQHGGEVGVESEPGQGSKFSFRLPRL
jgi:signal transduction histidine kinase